MPPNGTTQTPHPPHPTVPPGPRPLALHMAIQTSTWLGSLAALIASNGGLPPLRPDLAPDRARAAADLEKALASVDPDAFRAAVDRHARARMDAFTEGVRRYRAAPRPPRPDEPPAVWTDGEGRLRDFGATADLAADAPAVLVVPSLINRYTILDLEADRSLLRHLAGRGLRPLLVDWGAPRGGEASFTLSDYVAGRLGGALDAALGLTGGRPIAVVGYCMGGLLALALAARRAADVSALALLATPWDFHADGGPARRLLTSMMPAIETLISVQGVLPVDMLQALFAGLDPYAVGEKFRRFAAMAPDSAEARRFVAVEDWVNDGVPLAGPVARECLHGWYLRNDPARGEWRIEGEPVAPGNLTRPALVVVPARDVIVPPPSAEALARAIPGADLRRVAAGHIGMVAGDVARDGLFEPLADWLLARS